MINGLIQSPKTCIFHDFGLFYLLLPERATRLYCIFFWHDLFCAVPHRFAYQDFTDTSVALQPCLTRCRQNVGSTKTCIKNMKKKIICVGTTLYRIVNRDCHYSPIRGNRDCHYSPIRGIGRYYTVNKTQLEKFWYFDEMIKVYINIKRNSNLRLHQPFNKRIGLMKRGKTYRTLHHFSFGERFDETMMNAYHFGYQYIILSPHQFIGFSSANKSIEQTDGRKCHYPQAGRTSDLLAVRPADKGRRIISMKRKGLPIPLVLSQAFGNKKAIAH